MGTGAGIGQRGSRVGTREPESERQGCMGAGVGETRVVAGEMNANAGVGMVRAGVIAGIGKRVGQTGAKDGEWDY